MEDPDFNLSADPVIAGGADDAPKPPTAPEPEENPVSDPDEEQSGVIPGEIPGQPVDPADPRFPGSQPDLA
jgi:hypothetical protein